MNIRKVAGTVRTPEIFRIEDLCWIRARIRIGQDFWFKGKVDNEPQYIHYVVMEKYPYHVSCIDDEGLRRSFGFFELYQILYGTVPPAPVRRFLPRGFLH